MASIKEAVQSSQPRKAWDAVCKKAKGDLHAVPRSEKQVKDARYRFLKQGKGASGNTVNFADNLQQLLTRTNADGGDPFLRDISFSGSKVATLILYTDQQMQDVARFCCSAPAAETTVLGFDKTFNLGDVHVTVGAFKHLAVVRKSTGEHPIFPGPFFLHGNSDFRSYGKFFSHLAFELHGSPSEPTFGSDNERAMVDAIRKAFPQSKRLSCNRHLRSNLSDYLKEKIGLNAKSLMAITGAIFGPDGLVNASTEGFFDIKLHAVRALIQDEAPAAKEYFEARILPLLKENRSTATSGDFPLTWTNNNCESLNHVLKQQIDWKSRPLLTLVDELHEVVQHEYRQLEHCLVGLGDFRLCEQYQRFAVPLDVWTTKSPEQRERHLARFMKAIKPRDEKSVVSTDGFMAVAAPTGGKKAHQTKRKVAARTRTIQK